MKKLTKISVTTLVGFLIVPFVVAASIGVGVGTGKIELNEPLLPGQLNSINSIVVINTGDVGSDYAMGVEYNQNQSQKTPAKEWFVFQPNSFYLEPGETQLVSIKLNIPLEVEPGKYFAYLEARPTQKSTGANGTSVGIAAASKLYFSIDPANIFQAIYYRTISLVQKYSPVSYIVFGIIGLAVLVAILRRFISFEVNLKKKK